MDVEDDDSDDDGECDEDHGEQQILADERHDDRGRGDNLSQQQEEHSQGQQDGDAQCHLSCHVILHYVTPCHKHALRSATAYMMETNRLCAMSHISKVYLSRDERKFDKVLLNILL